MNIKGLYDFSIKVVISLLEIAPFSGENKCWHNIMSFTEIKIKS